MTWFGTPSNAANSRYLAPGVCDHDALRARNGGLCPRCHRAFLKYAQDPAQLYQRVVQERRERNAEACKTSLARFFRDSWDVLEPSTPLEDSWHFDVLGLHLEVVFHNWRRRKRTKDGSFNSLQNLLANLAPGTAKSRFVSVAFVAWAWTWDPTFSVIAVSQNPTVAVRDADFTRALIESEWYRQSFQPHWTLRADRHAVGYYQLESSTGIKLGWRRSFGVEGAVIGERADCLLMDDLHDPRSLEPYVLERQIAAVEKGFYNRVNNPTTSLRIAIMQRVHRQDISAHFLAKKAQPWIQLVIPLTRNEQVKNALRWVDPRNPGERLLPLRYTDQVIAAERDRLSPELVQALYEQDPPEYGGAVFTAAQFRWFRLEDDFPRPPHERPTGSNLAETHVVERRYDRRYFDSMAIVVDSNAAETNEQAKGSEVGIQVWGMLGRNHMLVDDRTAALGFNETIDEIKAARDAWPEVTKILIEKKALGPALLAALEREFSELEGLEAEKSKIARAKAASPKVRAGRVWIREGQAWNKKTCEQLYTFPYTPDRKNDRLDCTVHFINYTSEQDFSDRLEALAAM